MWKGKLHPERTAVSTGALVGRLFGTVGKLAAGAAMVAVLGVMTFWPAEVRKAPEPLSNQMPIRPGDLLVAETSIGRIEIEARSATERTYRWGEGCERSQTLEYGTRTTPVDSLVNGGLGDHWDDCGGVTRAVLQEGVKTFDTAAAAASWVASMTSAWNTELARPAGTTFYAYSGDGVLVGWGVVTGRHQLDVEVWRVLVNGKAPNALPGTGEGRAEIRQAQPSAT
jgi:hypothetical protein